MRIELSFDDGCDHDIRIAELLVKHGLEKYAVFYIPSKWTRLADEKGWMPLSREQFRDLSDNFEIGSHGVNHQYLTKIPFEVARFEIENSKIELQNSTGQEITKFAYPRGYANDNLKDIVRKVYLHGRNTLVGSIHEQEDPSWQNTTVHMGYSRLEYNGKSWYEYGRELLHKARDKEDTIFRAWGHSWEIDRYDAWHGMDTLFSELSSLVRESASIFSAV